MVDGTITVKKMVSPCIPYLTVGVGLLLFHNAWIAIFSYHAGMLLMLFPAKSRIPFR
ncbi:MAG: hypothetical protein Q8P44_07480 [Dehalococcoidia bacterium]|nr:hypothetical protein [Dehalococcoidia bacterium]